MVTNYAQLYNLDGGSAMNRSYRMPAEIAATQKEFGPLFTPPGNDWDKVNGFALAHILAYELDELILNTPGMWSAEIRDEKAELMEVLRDRLNLSPEHAYWVIDNMYIPTEDEYYELCKKEFGKQKDYAPIVKGVYDSSYTLYSDTVQKNKLPFSSDAEGRAHFNFCKAKWDEVHDARVKARVDDLLKEKDENAEVDEFLAEESEWIRGEHEPMNDYIKRLKKIVETTGRSANSTAAEIRTRIEAEWQLLPPDEQAAWGEV